MIKRPMLPLRLDHMAIHVASRDAAEVVARELLGLHVLEELEIPSDVGAGFLRVMKHPDDPFYVVLCEGATASHPIAQSIVERGPGAHHLAHGVADLDAALASARAEGATPVGEVAEVDALRQIFVKVAADGLLHEIIERRGDEVFVPKNTANLIKAGALAGADDELDVDAGRQRR